MFGLTVLDVAIGLTFVYLLLSLVVTAASELIASYLKWRAANLQKGLERLLNMTLAAELYAHPLIQKLAKSGQQPSYIPARTFALALLDVLASRQPGPGSPTAATGIQALLQAAPDPEVRRVLGVFAQEAGQDLEKLKKGIEDWFDTSMDRVAGWYKRKTQAVVVVLAIVLTVAVNVDSLLIVRSLSNDAALRAMLVAQAQELAKERLPQQKTDQQGADVKPAIDELEKRIQRLTTLGVPVGWTGVAGADYRQWPGWLPLNIETAVWAALWWHTVRYHFLGWVLTALAASLGAPFWFDILKKVITIRSSGRVPKKESEPSAEPTKALPSAPSP